MDNLFVLRGKMQEIYARYSRIFDKALQFILALVAFFMINNNIGFMKMLAQPTITLALAVICTFFPLLITVVAAAGVILCHMYAASLGMFLVTGILFFVMFVFYLRLTPKKGMVVLLTPIAFLLNIPYVIPVAYALVSGPITMVAVLCGVVVYYMMQYVKNAAPALQSEEASGLMNQMTAYVKQVFLNRQMWIVIIAFIICFLLVYTIRRQALDHAWKIAIVAGAVINVVVIAAGNIAMGTHTEYGSMIIGNVAAVVIGLILEFFFFSVDYAKSESLQFEDDEYYYYVKAVPKLNVSTREKTVKRINERQQYRDEAEDDGMEDEFESSSYREATYNKHSLNRPSPMRGPATKRQDIDEVDKMLLTQSLKKDLGIND